jgi:hypothetical protein
MEHYHRRVEMERKPPPEERGPKKHKTGDSTEHQAAAVDTSGIKQPALATMDDRKKQYIACIRDEDKSTDNLSKQLFSVKEGKNEIEQRIDAAAKALADLEKITSPPKSGGGLAAVYLAADNSESDSEESYQNKGPVLTETHRRFMEALPYCVPLDAGFNVQAYRVGDDKHCSCACGPMLKPWRDLYNIHLDTEEKCSGTAFTPNALMGHLKTKGGMYKTRKGLIPLNCIYHYGILLYLTYLYNDWHGRGKSFL